ncbi:MAG: hypothetical protein U5K79_09770 [Cyclobacteriaceae bacterium]|nr:hypothetical protein [Cyclobacteriaceae bacterium]
MSLFSYRHINQDHFDFGSYFQSLIEEIKSLEQFGLKEIIYAALDLPMFYYFLFPKLAAFKLYFWRRNVFDYTKSIENRYSFANIPEEELSRSLKMARAYLKVPTTEIWSEETLNSTLRQINFYYEMGLLRKPPGKLWTFWTTCEKLLIMYANKLKLDLSFTRTRCRRLMAEQIKTISKYITTRLHFPKMWLL